MKNYKIRVVDTLTGTVIDTNLSVAKAKSLLHAISSTAYSKLKVYRLR